MQMLKGTDSNYGRGDSNQAEKAAYLFGATVMNQSKVRTR